MCGIFGMIAERGPESERALARGLASLAHRGPDDEGAVWLPLRGDSGRAVGLGSRRLAVLDLSPAGHMPMRDPFSGNCLIYNGEIYNFAEIRRELEKLGRRFTSTGDTEVLLQAYEEWGEACVLRLRGMYAFALWDADEEKLLLVRDHMGIKPLYYYQSADRLVFASEVRALLESGVVPRRLDRAGVISYLEFGAVQDPLTAVEGVRSLLPGAMRVWCKGKSQSRSYWDLASVARRSPATGSLEEAVRTLKPMLLDAVSQRLVSDVSLGLFLSGGVDSSAVASLAREVTPGPIDTFSVVFRERDFDESAYSDEVARAFGTRHHRIELSDGDLLAELPSVFEAMDQPSIDGANTYIVSHGVKKAGITVALSGLGGDELFAGYSTFRSLPRLLSCRSVLGLAGALARGAGRWADPLEPNRFSKALALVREDYPGGHPYFLLRSLFLPSGVRALLDTRSDGEALAGVPSAAIPGLEMVNQISVLEASTYMRSTLLRDTDVMSMRHALEVRVPFVDHRLWEYVLPLRARLKLDSSLPKPLLLQALPRPLPQRCYQRRKKGFSLPFEAWMKGTLRPAVETDLSRSLPPEQWPLDRRAVRTVWEAFLNGKTSWSRPWSLFVLKQWIERNRCTCDEMGVFVPGPVDSEALSFAALGLESVA
jgi:asparagine synthase (glutamine-hydrolysing)